MKKTDSHSAISATFLLNICSDINGDTKWEASSDVSLDEEYIPDAKREDVYF